MTAAQHEDSSRSCPDAQGYAITPHAPHTWTDEDLSKHLCEGAH